MSSSRATWLARTIRDDLALVFEAEVRDCRDQQMMAPELSQAIDEARAAFLEDHPDQRLVFDRFMNELLGPPSPGARTEAAPTLAPVHDRTVLEGLAQALAARLPFVEAVVEAADLAVEARLHHRNHDARLRVAPAVRWGEEDELHLAGACGPGAAVRLVPQRGLLAFFRRLGELQVGIAPVDDAYIIDGTADAIELVQALGAPLLRLAPCPDVVVQLSGGQLRASVRLREPRPPSRLDAAVALVELWARALDVRLGLA